MNTPQFCSSKFTLPLVFSFLGFSCLMASLTWIDIQADEIDDVAGLATEVLEQTKALKTQDIETKSSAYQEAKRKQEALYLRIVSGQIPDSNLSAIRIAYWPRTPSEFKEQVLDRLVTQKKSQSTSWTRKHYNLVFEGLSDDLLAPLAFVPGQAIVTPENHIPIHGLNFINDQKDLLESDFICQAVDAVNEEYHKTVLDPLIKKPNALQRKALQAAAQENIISLIKSNSLNVE